MPFFLYHDSGPSPQEKLENKETSAIMHRIINDLPEMYREIIQFKRIWKNFHMRKLLRRPDRISIH